MNIDVIVKNIKKLETKTNYLRYFDVNDLERDLKELIRLKQLLELCKHAKEELNDKIRYIK